MKTLLAILLSLAPTQADKKSNPGFEQIKKLEGTWEGTDKDHPARLTYKSSSGGTVMLESIGMPDHADMLTLYHLEGDDLVLTHYCMLGNQPHMKAQKDSKEGMIRFVCTGGGNLKCAADKHMHALTVTFVDADHLMQEWTLYDGGKEQMVVTFNLARKK